MTSISNFGYQPGLIGVKRQPQEKPAVEPKAEEVTT